MLNYRVYLKSGGTYVERIPCSSLEEVQIVLENSRYDEYLVIQHDIELNMDTPIMMGESEKKKEYPRKR